VLRLAGSWASDRYVRASGRERGERERARGGERAVGLMGESREGRGSGRGRRRGRGRVRDLCVDPLLSNLLRRAVDEAGLEPGSVVGEALCEASSRILLSCCPIPRVVSADTPQIMLSARLHLLSPTPSLPPPTLSLSGPQAPCHGRLDLWSKHWVRNSQNRAARHRRAQNAASAGHMLPGSPSRVQN